MAGIVEYWTVDANTSRVHIFRNPQGLHYVDRSVVGRGEFVSPLVAKNAVLDIGDLFGGS